MRPQLVPALVLLAGAVQAAGVRGAATADGGLVLGAHGALAASGIVAGVALIAIGLLMNYLGYRLVKALVFLAGFCVAGGLVLYAEYRIRAPREGEKARQLGYLATAAALGASAGSAALYLSRAGIALVGALGGFALASWALSMRTGATIHSDVGRAVFIMALVAGGVAAALMLQRPAIIGLSSAWGAYALFVGIDCFARTGFQYAALAFLSVPGASFAMSPGVYAMVAGMALSALLGAVVQLRLTAKHKSPSALL
ncbi:hypothetical protein LPJ61_000299 [Coemansia biformis]|uniref:Transmembrane protein 198 n=1 Tax=Coemansia biformis TaxID=1286918 RepID=A0A9W7YJY8_9FUNG|nr:hypothetical protein LPJ61_000299 [Coemansia biformis]